VHDRSKEFQETDEHIEKVHRDLKNAINSIVFSSGTSERDERFDNAFHLIKIGRYEAAQKEFDSLCEKCSNNYESWWGEILLLTKNFTDMSENNVCSEEMVLYINNMRGTKNYSQEIEEILVQNLEKYFSGSRAEIEGQLENLKNQIESENAKFQQLKDKREKMTHEKEELQGIVDKEKDQMKQAQDKSETIGCGVFCVALLLIEAYVIHYFYKWEMVTPVKVVAGIVAVVLVFFAVFFVYTILSLIYDKVHIKMSTRLSELDSKMSAHSRQLDRMSIQETSLQNRMDTITPDIESYTREQKKIEARLAFYDSIDFQRPDTFLAWDASSFLERVMDASTDANEESGQQNADDVNMENEAGKKAAFCPNCGMQVTDNGSFCHACGSPL
jgi:hypothetical protein